MPHEKTMTPADAVVGLSQQQVAELEHPTANPSLATLEVIAKGAGAVLDVRLVA